MLGLYVTNNIEKRPNCIREPKTGKALTFSIPCRYTEQFEQFVLETNEPYMTMDEYAAEYGSDGPWLSYHFLVGPEGVDEGQESSLPQTSSSGARLVVSSFGSSTCESSRSFNYNVQTGFCIRNIVHIQIYNSIKSLKLEFRKYQYIARSANEIT